MMMVVEVEVVVVVVIDGSDGCGGGRVAFVTPLQPLLGLNPTIQGCGDVKEDEEEEEEEEEKEKVVAVPFHLVTGFRLS